MSIATFGNKMMYIVGAPINNINQVYNRKNNIS